MSNLIKQPYEISIWEDQIITDTNNKRYFKENLIAIIGSNTMDTPVRVFNPSLTQNINGTSVLSFSIFSSYYDEITDSMILNPFTSLLVNERKIKLKYGKNQDNEDQWYDFVIKNIQEDSSQNIFIYTAYDLHIEELSKTGFKIELNSELGNNQGKITDLAKTIMKGTDWEVLSEGSDIIRQTVSEPLYEVTLNEEISAQDMITDESVSIDPGEVIYASYHSINERDPYFQFFYRADGAYEIDDDRNLLNAPAGSNYYLDNVTYNEVEGQYVPIPTFAKEESPVSVSGDFRGKRLVRKQSIIYDPTIDRYVKVYKDEDNQDKEVYGLEETEYLTVTTVQNFVSNSEDFESTNGWSVNPNDSISNVIYPKATAENIANNTLHDYLKVNFSSGSAGLIHNTGFKDNRNKIHDLTLGEKYVFRIKYRIGSTTPTATDFSGNRLNAKILPYSIDGNGNFDFGQANPYIDFNGTEPNFVVETAAGKIGYYHIIGTVSRSLSYSDLINTKIGLFLYPAAPSPSAITYWIEDVQLFKYRLNSDNGIVFPGDVPESIIKTVYKYYYPNEDYKSIDDISFIYNNTIPASNFSNVYDPDFQKIRSITTSESNRYNLIQSLCETFECWAKFDIERNPATGEILRDESTGRLKKRISFHEYIGKDNDAGFKYGINLLSINRQLSSEQIVTKLIVKNNANQFGKDGFTSIARASENPIKENFLLNFKHFIQQGLLDFAEFDNDLYGSTSEGWIGYYRELRRINQNNSKIIEEVSKQKTEVSKLESNLQTYTLARNTASEKIAASKTELKNYTGCTYQNFIDGISQTTKWIENDAVKKIIETIKNNTRTFEKYQPLVLAYESYLESLNQAIIANENILKDDVAEKQALDDKFYNKYYTFIKEGSWISEDYVDDNLYFLDAQSVLYDSASPQISYTINVIDLSALPEYENYKFDLGDKTYVEHTEFFGWFINSSGQKTPYKEEVIVSQVIYNLDNPEQNQISIQNYKTQFEDLFQRIAATVQSAQYRAGAYERVANIMDTNGIINSKTLQDSLTYNQFMISNASDQSVVWDETGITVTDLQKPNEILRLVSGGILLTTDGGLNWNYGITGRGINADFITAGQIDTSRINIMGGGSSAFRWDHTGLNAYSFVRDENSVPRFFDITNFIRFDQYGIYAYSGENAFLPSGEAAIRDAAGTKFALTRRGFFLRSVKDNGYLLLDSERDFVVVDKNEKERVKIGLLNSDVYGLQLRNSAGDVVLESSSTGSLFLRELLSIGPNSYVPRTQLGVISTDGNDVSKIFAINNKNGVEQLAMFDDGLIVVKNIKIEGNSEIGNMTVEQYEQSAEEFLLKSETTTIFKVTPAQGSNPETVTPLSINLFVDYKNIATIDSTSIKWQWTTDYANWNPIQKNNEDHTGETLSLTYEELSSILDISDLVAIIAYVPDTEYSSLINLTRIKDGIIGQDGVGIESTSIRYQAGTSGTTAPTEIWQTTVPDVEANEYLWTRVIINYTDGDPTTSYSVGKMGAQGPQGAKGDKGDQGPQGPQGATGDRGPKGDTGTSVTEVTEMYLATSASTGVTTSTSGWTTSVQTMTATDKYLWNYEIIHFSDDTSAPTVPVIIGVYGNTGATGATGRSLTSVTEMYLASASATGVTRSSTNDWTEAMQTTSTTKPYLWNYEILTWSSGTSPTYVDPIIIGVHGATGVGIESTSIRYQAGTSGTIAPEGMWLTTIPDVEANEYLWTRVIINYTDGDWTTSYSVGKMGAQGAKGDKGDQGPQGATGDRGPKGDTGTSVIGVTEMYLATSASTGVTTSNPNWDTSMQTMTATNKYLWNYEIIHFSDSTSAPTVPVIIGVYGNTGATGRSLTSVKEMYLASASATGVTRSTSGWTEAMQTTSTTKKYLWNYEILTWSSGTSPTYIEPIIIGIHGATGAKGDKGDQGPQGATGERGPKGDTGTSVEGVTEMYLATSAWTGVTTSTSGWTETMQTMTTTKKYLWNYEIISFSDGSSAPTVPVIIGVYGDTGATGRSLTSVTEMYLASASASGVTRSTSGWTEAMQTTSTSKRYLWNYEILTWSSGTSPTYIEPIIIGVHGATGAKGDKGDQGIQGATGERGPKGDTGTSVEGVTEKYLATSASTGVTTSTSGWTETMQTMTTTKKYLWNYEIIHFSDNTSSPTVPVIIGVYGNTGATGATGATGRSLTAVTEKYLASASASGVTRSTGGWTDAVQTTSTSKPYLWNYEILTWSSGTSPTYIEPIIIGVHGATGAKGDKGDQGAQGPQGATGAAGVGIASTSVRYQAGASGVAVPTGEWLTTIPTVAANQYLWTRVVITYTSGNPTTSYSIGKMGAQGPQGATGAAGVGIASTSVRYQAGASGVNAPTGAWLTTIPTVTANQYLWTRVIITYTSGNPTTSYSVGKMGAQGPQGIQGPQGPKGNTGDQGPQGIQGPQGPTGTSQYVHIRYSANSTGNPMTTTPQGTTKYIGLANTTSSTAPTGYSSYKWSLVQGPQGNQGIQGPAGANGTTTYTWIKYANTDTGSGMSDTPAGKKYIGLAFNKTTPTESTTASHYTWSLMPQNIEIGGRNYWALSKNAWHSYLKHEGGGLFTNASITTSYAIFRMDRLGVSVGETYTISFQIKAKTDSVQFSNSNYYVNSAITVQHNKPQLENGKWVTVKATFNYTTENTTLTHIYFTGLTATNQFEIRNFQLEKGNVATDWTPAPEDVDAAIGEALNWIGDVDRKYDDAIIALANDDSISPLERANITTIIADITTDTSILVAKLGDNTTAVTALSTASNNLLSFLQTASQEDGQNAINFNDLAFRYSTYKTAVAAAENIILSAQVDKWSTIESDQWELGSRIGSYEDRLRLEANKISMYINKGYGLEMAMQLAQDELGFYVDNQKRAWIGLNGLNAMQGTFGESLTIGNHKITKNGTDYTIIGWTGG